MPLICFRIKPNRLICVNCWPDLKGTTWQSLLKPAFEAYALPSPRIRVVMVHFEDMVELCMVTCGRAFPFIPSSEAVDKYIMEFLRKPGVAVAPLYNSGWSKNDFLSGIVKRVVGFAAQRSLPTVGGTTLSSWAKKQSYSSGTNKKVYLFSDEFTEYNDVEIGKTAYKLLIGQLYRSVSATEDTGQLGIGLSKASRISNMKHLYPASWSARIDLQVSDLCKDRSGKRICTGMFNQTGEIHISVNGEEDIKANKHLLHFNGFNIKENIMAIIDQITTYLGNEADELLRYESKAVAKDILHLPSPDFIDQVYGISDRNPQTIRSLGQLFGYGRLGNTGYYPFYRLIRASVHADTHNKIPFIVKINHNELFDDPNKSEQILYLRTVRRSLESWSAAVGATIYFGSDDSGRQIVEVAKAFEEAHRLGMATILWCYLRNDAFKTGGKDYHLSADLTGQANHLGVTIQADIIKQKITGIKRRLISAQYGQQQLMASSTERACITGTASDHPN
ncbi:hypothetical protein FQR65_LT17886 [Abscondita terminalis]|nr:hypothetical protein FQR65_LT17886 [Abscondita terminalis]